MSMVGKDDLGKYAIVRDLQGNILGCGIANAICEVPMLLVAKDDGSSWWCRSDMAEVIEPEGRA